MSTVHLIRGDARRIPLANGSVHCVVTSPPYWGLRDYGTARWEGGDAGCDHLAPANPQRYFNGQGAVYEKGGAPSARRNESQYRDLCGKCGARRVDRQIGLEPTPDAFVATMVAVFREVKRVLRDDGTCWVNLGDSYAGGGHGGGGSFGPERHWREGNPDKDGGVSNRDGLGRVVGLKPKDLIGMPWRVALALQADDWYLRMDVIWHKPNPMPESCNDRPTKSHEYVFLLSKRERYFYDADAVREKNSGMVPWGKLTRPKDASHDGDIHGDMTMRRREFDKYRDTESGRNLRSVWPIATEAYPGAHFATYPRKLVEPCIKAGCPPGGIVLDPFVGSGTTMVVAHALGRRGIGLDLSGEYLRLAERRINRPHARTPRPVRDDDELPLFATI